MTPTASLAPILPRWRFYIFWLACLWSLIMLGLALLAAFQTTQTTRHLALSEARAPLAKDQAFRLWALCTAAFTCLLPKLRRPILT
ncbi:MAG: hypothetical protein L0Z70_14455 [Chloroflexi bacterium]|nr:hypothetical protein [Chloroflexota bacterium]